MVIVSESARHHASHDGSDSRQCENPDDQRHPDEYQRGGRTGLAALVDRVVLAGTEVDAGLRVLSVPRRLRHKSSIVVCSEETIVRGTAAEMAQPCLPLVFAGSAAVFAVSSRQRSEFMDAVVPHRMEGSVKPEHSRRSPPTSRIASENNYRSKVGCPRSYWRIRPTAATPTCNWRRQRESS